MDITRAFKPSKMKTRFSNDISKEALYHCLIKKLNKRACALSH